MSDEMGTESSTERQGAALVPGFGLLPGQLWRLRGGYVEIDSLGEKVAQYRILWHPEQRSTVTRMMRIEVLQAYLHENAAELVT